MNVINYTMYETYIMHLTAYKIANEDNKSHQIGSPE